MNLIRIHKNLLIILSLSLPFKWTSSTAQISDMFDKNNSFRYINYLIKTEKYSEAIAELSELIPKYQIKEDSVYVKLLYLYRKNNTSKIGLTEIDKVYSNYSLFSRELAIQYAINCIKESKFDVLYKLTHEAPYLTLSDKSILVNSMLIVNRKFKENFLLLDKTQDSCCSELYNKLVIINKRYESKIYKKPILAAILSSCVPGAGRFYVGEKQNAFNSFAMVSAFSIFSIRGFNHYQLQSVRGWLFGGLAVGFYVGNIYGSYKSAVKYNDQQNDLLKKEIEYVLDEYYAEIL